MFKKLNDKEYIIPTAGIKKVENLINRISAKRDRLIEKGQIEETDFIPLKAEFHGLKKNTIDSLKLNDREKNDLNAHRNSHALLQLQGEVPNVNQWAILGVIEPVLGQNEKYTLHSYSKQDLPQVYRDLENPTQCEHCDTNRKRNKTFVIQNVDSDEVLQVGSSCMKDFISSESLSMLMAYSNLFKEIATIGEDSELQRSVELVNKEEFIATLDAVKEIKETQDTFDLSSVNEIDASLAFLYFEYLENPSILEKEKPSAKDIVTKINVTENNLDKAESIVDFFEELDTSQYNDHVFNITTLVGSDFEFLSQQECIKIADAPQIKNAIENKTADLRALLARPQNGAIIEGKTEILPEYIKKEDFVAALNSIADVDGSYNSYGNATPSNPGEVDKALFLISDTHFKQHLEMVQQREGDQGAEHFKNIMNCYEIDEQHYDNAQKVIQFFQQNSSAMKSDYQYKMASVIGNNNDDINIKDARYCGYAYHFYQQNQVNLDQGKDLKETTKEKQSNGIIRFLGTAKDRFEQIELQYVNRNRIESLYGNFYLHQFQDIHGNTFTGTSKSDNPFNEEHGDNKFNKWIVMAGSIKGHKNYNRKIANNFSDTIPEKQTQLNRIKAIGDFHETPQTDGEPVLKGKYNYGALKTEEITQYDDSFLYEFKDNNNKQYFFLTKNDLGVEKNDVFKAGFQASSNETDIFNIEKKSIAPAQEPSSEFEHLTQKQLEKYIDNNKPDGSLRKRPKNN